MLKWFFCLLTDLSNNTNDRVNLSTKYGKLNRINKIEIKFGKNKHIGNAVALHRYQRTLPYDIVQWLVSNSQSAMVLLIN